METLAIIGGGAAGLFAAIAAGRKSNGTKIIIIERKDRIGKKILATGNGRCNLSNINASTQNYYGKSPEFVKFALKNFNPEQTIDFFSDLGLICKNEYGGRVYPFCDQASAVLDVLRNEITRMKIEIIENTEITKIEKSKIEKSKIEKSKNNFILSSNLSDKKFQAQKVILTTGGCATPALGSNGSGFRILKDLNHKIISPVPALCQIRTENKITKSLQGIKFDGVITAKRHKKIIASEAGEVLFTEYGLSGTAVLYLSRVLYNNEDLIVSLDFMPQYSHDELRKFLIDRRERMKHLTMENFLVGVINKKLGYAIIKLSDIEKLSLPVDSLSNTQINEITAKLKGLELAVEGHNGWDNAQVTAGGALTEQFNEETMESKITQGLYAAGEVLDIFGDCGGYNLQWAWSSGYLAGNSAVEKGKFEC